MSWSKIIKGIAVKVESAPAGKKKGGVAVTLAGHGTEVTVKRTPPKKRCCLGRFCHCRRH